MGDNQWKRYKRSLENINNESLHSVYDLETEGSKLHFPAGTLYNPNGKLHTTSVNGDLFCAIHYLTHMVEDLTQKVQDLKETLTKEIKNVSDKTNGINKLDISLRKTEKEVSKLNAEHINMLMSLDDDRKQNNLLFERITDNLKTLRETVVYGDIVDDLESSNEKD